MAHRLLISLKTPTNTSGGFARLTEGASMAVFHVSMAVELPDDPDLEVDDVEAELRQLADTNGWTIMNLAVVQS